MNTRNGLILAIDEVATATVFAMSAMAAHKTHAHPLSFFPALHTGSYGFDLSDHFMAGNARVSVSPGKPPSTVRASLWQTPQASTRILTCPKAGSIIARSTTSNLPGWVACTAL